MKLFPSTVALIDGLDGPLPSLLTRHKAWIERDPLAIGPGHPISNGLMGVAILLCSGCVIYSGSLKPAAAPVVFAFTVLPGSELLCSYTQELRAVGADSTRPQRRFLSEWW